MARASTVKEPKAPAKEGGSANASDDDDKAVFEVSERPSVTFADVAGLHQVKEAVRDNFILIEKHPDVRERYRLKPGRGMLLYGPPGTGKTFIAQAIAGEIQAAFYSAKASDLMSKWFGTSEKRIRDLFEQARVHDRAIIFLDEFDAVSVKRDATGSSVMPRIVSELLQQLQGFQGGKEKGQVFLLAATNKPWSIDEAMLRPGRIDRLFYIPPPDPEARAELFRLKLKGRPLGEEVDADALAGRTEGYSGADISEVCERSALIAAKRAVAQQGRDAITMEDVDAALADVKPSIDRAMVARYEKWLADRGG